MSTNTNSESTQADIARGDVLDVTIERMAHGGEGIGFAPDGRVVFVHGTFPGDEVRARAHKVKKAFIRAELVEVVAPGPLRVEGNCPAAALGAGCCDFAELDPAREAELKASVLTDQLHRVAKQDWNASDIEIHDLRPQRGWRTRVRLGVDSQGRAGTRKRGSNDLVTSVACTQLAPGLVEDIVGPDARRFSPGAEVVVVLDSTGERHVMETRKAPRGRRVETIREVIEGSGEVSQVSDGHTFRFPATAFWQAHTAAPEAYTALVRRWLSAALMPAIEPLDTADTAAGASAATADVAGSTDAKDRLVAWDLYGGVGLFVPSLAQVTGEPVISVDYSPAATASQQPDLEQYDVKVESARVEKVAPQLPKPSAVVLDPPRTGAGPEVVSAVAAAGPRAIIHIGCDPATFSRDVADWAEHGYLVKRLALLNAFPGTHHFETIALLSAH
ncbi:class I SAM-dependent RNA methyltransferase [Corynebacterium flavescens]|uniref:class I SAM-dependent RNA methyltransferase n=1 Tax=Corynebacterium flavescens TaxID=28028 RepID=UPI003FD030C5